MIDFNFEIQISLIFNSANSNNLSQAAKLSPVGYQVSLVVSGSSSRSDDRGLIPRRPLGDT